jgi:hypothetical protein
MEECKGCDIESVEDAIFRWCAPCLSRFDMRISGPLNGFEYIVLTHPDGFEEVIDKRVVLVEQEYEGKKTKHKRRKKYE